MEVLTMLILSYRCQYLSDRWRQLSQAGRFWLSSENQSSHYNARGIAGLCWNTRL